MRRITIRKLMLAIVALAILLRLIVVGFQVWRQPNLSTLHHLRRFVHNNEPYVYSHGTNPAEYWAEYWRKVLGLPWPGGFVCSCKAQQENEFGKATVDVETSHEMDLLIDHMNKL